MGLETVNRRSWRVALLAAIALAAGAAACTPMQWVDMKSGSTEGSATALEECRTLARNDSWRGQWYHNWPPHFFEPDPRYPGSRQPFWHGRPFSQELYYKLQDFCMRSRGFQLVEKPDT